MIVRAPGKLLVTGAYAVLEGAPAVVCAVDRFAYARTDANEIDTREMYDGDRKLGLGSSAASTVARLGARAAAAGEDLADAQVRERIFADARAEHAREQSGGSGVDVAASTFGGALVYSLGPGGPVHRSVRVPDGLHFDAFWSGTSARTSDLRARVDALRARDEATYRARMADLASAAERGAAAVDAGNLHALIEAARGTLRALSALGRDADAPIVPSAFAELAAVAENNGAAFLPSGAGGGDVGVFLGPDAPPIEVRKWAADIGMRPLTVRIDQDGLRTVSSQRH